MHPDSITHWLRKFTKKNGLNHVSPHMLRHTQATVFVNQNVDIVTISKRLGHSNPTTTQKIYAHQIKNSDEKANEKLRMFFCGKQQRSGKRHCCQKVDNNKLILHL